MFYIWSHPPIKLQKLLGTSAKKTGKMWEFFQSQGPPPSPKFGNPMFVRRKKIMVYFAF